MDDLGQLLANRYRLTDLLGQGGMGAVWRARDEQLSREVAVKELRLPEHLDAAQRQTWIARLDREARAAARLKHPGIITVHDRITGDDGRPWIVMELVRGPSLDGLLKANGPLPPHQAADIGLQMLAALRAAHQMGITHRDIKPANVLLEGTRVVLTDFGIAALDGDATLTASGALMGTPAFMAPEQVRGQPTTVASDLWSLGATLYTAVEGHPPFGGASTGAVFVAIATEEPAPATHAGSLQPALHGLLRKNPAERPTADQLQTLLTQPPHPVRVGAPATPPAEMPYGRPAARVSLMAIGAAALLVLVAVAAVSWYLISKNPNTVDEHTIQALGAPDGFKRTWDKKDGKRTRVTYLGCPTANCGDGTIARNVEPVRTWLMSINSIKSVGPAQITASGCVDSGCPIHTTNARNPAITNVMLYRQADNRLRLELNVG